MQLDKIALAQALSKLTDQEQKIIYLWFFKNLSLQEISIELDISAKHVSNLLNQSLDLLRVYSLGETTRETEKNIEVVKSKIIDASNILIENFKKYPEDIYHTSPRGFEELIATLLIGMGFEVHLTPQTRDGGRDILAYLNTQIGKILCLVEVKRHNPQNPVGIGVIRNLYGTLCDEQANSAMLVTTLYFTADAREFQKRHFHRLALKEYDDIIKWINRYKG